MEDAQGCDLSTSVPKGVLDGKYMFLNLPTGRNREQNFRPMPSNNSGREVEEDCYTSLI